MAGQSAICLREPRRPRDWTCHRPARGVDAPSPGRCAHRNHHHPAHALRCLPGGRCPAGVRSPGRALGWPLPQSAIVALLLLQYTPASQCGLERAGLPAERPALPADRLATAQHRGQHRGLLAAHAALASAAHQPGRHRRAHRLDFSRGLFTAPGQPSFACPRPVSRMAPGGDRRLQWFPVCRATASRSPERPGR